MLLDTSEDQLPLQSEIQMTWLSSQDITVLTATLPSFLMEGTESDFVLHWWGKKCFQIPGLDVESEKDNVS